MIILQAPSWDDYKLLDSGYGKRLERFGRYILIRPDPQVLWKPRLTKSEWDKADAVFEKDKWIIKNKIPDKWLLKYKDLCFWAKLSPFKHTGIFPEQSAQWDFIEETIKQEKRQVNILNLFAYTGLATLTAAKAGAKVTHIDASYPTIGWARENQEASHLGDKPIRWILDDAIKFVHREIKRGVKYDGIIMDPPIFGHGPKGEKWDFNESFPKLLELCKQVLSDKPIFIIINAYAISASSIMLENILKDLNLGGKIEAGELALKEENSERLLSTGIFARWSNN